MPIVAAGAVLASSELEVMRDVAVIRQSMKDIDEGKGISIDDMHTQLRSELLAMQAARNLGK